MREQRFDRVLLEAVDEALSSLGKSARRAIYYHLEKRFNIKKQEIAQKIEAFTKGIEDIFGIGARHIEILIMKRIHQKVGGSLEWCEAKDLTFIEYVTEKRKLLEKRKSQVTVEELIQCQEAVTKH